MKSLFVFCIIFVTPFFSTFFLSAAPAPFSPSSLIPPVSVTPDQTPDNLAWEKTISFMDDIIKNKMQQHPPTGIDETRYIENLYTKIIAENNDFIQQYPDSKHVGDAYLHIILFMPEEKEDDKKFERLKKMNDYLRLINDNPNVPSHTKSNAELCVLERWAGNIDLLKKTEPDSVTQTDQAYINFIKKYQITQPEIAIDAMLDRAEFLKKIDFKKAIVYIHQLIPKISAKDFPKKSERAYGLLAKMEIIGHSLPLSLTAIDGTPINFAKMKGKVILIDFWETTSAPCLVTLPKVKALYDQYHDKGLEIVGISFDKDKDTLTNFVTQQHIQWPQYFDTKFSGDDIQRKYSIERTPEFWLINKEGKVIFTDLHSEESDTLEQKIIHLM